MPDLVFHYAPWAILPAIVASGSLRPSNAGALAEQPLLWFSANQVWEPTATKMIRAKDGTVSQLSFDEQLARLGCIRFGLGASDARLLNWKSACTAAGTPRDQRRALERSGRKRGADHAHWFAVAGPVVLGDLAFHVFAEKAWHAADPGEMAEVWTRVRGKGP